MPKQSRGGKGSVKTVEADGTGKVRCKGRWGLLQERERAERVVQGLTRTTGFLRWRDLVRLGLLIMGYILDEIERAADRCREAEKALGPVIDAVERDPDAEGVPAAIEDARRTFWDVHHKIEPILEAIPDDGGSKFVAEKRERLQAARKSAPARAGNPRDGSAVLRRITAGMTRVGGNPVQDSASEGPKRPSDVSEPSDTLRLWRVALSSSARDLEQIATLLRAREAHVTRTSPRTSLAPVERVAHLLSRFDLVARRLRNRHAGRQALLIKDEYDVQDLLHALLLIDFDDIRPEDPSPTHAGGASRMDFLLKNERIVIEVKMTRASLTEKQMGEELLVDIARYEQHPDCGTLVCFIYDPDLRIGNPAGLKRDLESRSTEKVKVVVCIVPT